MKASLCYRALLLSLFWAPAASARPTIIMPDVETRPRIDHLDLPGIAFLDGNLGSHELELIEERVFIDPLRGTVSATVSVTLTAGPGGLSALLMLIDAGLLVDRVYDDNGDLPYDQLAQDGYRYVQPSLQPPAAQGTQVTLHFSYAGTLICPSDGRFASCDFGGARLDFAFAGTAFPIFYDPFDYSSTAYYERRISISVPSGQNVYVTADEISRDDDGTTLTVDWRIPVRQDFAAYLALFGDLAEREVPGTSVPARVIHLASDSDWIDQIAGWTPDIVAFLDGQAGRTFPFPRLTLVKLPDSARFPGTAGHATSLLAEFYGESSERYFEETFAHETSHVWWGVLAVEQATNTRFLTEGMATFSQIDYSSKVIFAGADRDRYLGRRYNEMKVLSRYATPFGSLPPVVPPAGDPGPGAAYTEWAYLKGASTLELLRVSIGEEAFAAGLAAYAGSCVNVPCTTQDFQDAMSGAAGQDLSWFFDAYVYASTEPSVTIDFDQDTIRLAQAGVGYGSYELWLELEDGTRAKQRVNVEGAEAIVPVEGAAARVLRVRPNPRLEPLIRFASSHELDVDFDGELDGADLVRCAHQVGGEALLPAIGEGVFTGNVDFEARCDQVVNGRIDPSDLDVLLSRFPEVRP
jgi:hypothetical protein